MSTATPPEHVAAAGGAAPLDPEPFADVQPLAVGSRVVVDGARGTVRYVGPVVTSKTAGAVYAGIEWDDAARGKNDGAVVDATTGVVTRYFTAAGATRASFVKADLV